MKKDNVKTEDELRPEYDLMSLKVRKVGPKRKSFYGTTVRLETDVAKVFPNSGSVNEALRFLIRITQKTSHHSLAVPRILDWQSTPGIWLPWPSGFALRATP